MTGAERNGPTSENKSKRGARDFSGASAPFSGNSREFCFEMTVVVVVERNISRFFSHICFLLSFSPILFPLSFIFCLSIIFLHLFSYLHFSGS